MTLEKPSMFLYWMIGHIKSIIGQVNLFIEHSLKTINTVFKAGRVAVCCCGRIALNEVTAV